MRERTRSAGRRPSVRPRSLIAVVNDDTTFLKLMNDLLTGEGYETFIHTVGSTAYERIKSTMPDLVILDIRMEHAGSGWLTLDLMRLDPVTKDIPVIVCSADVQQLRDKDEVLRSHGCLPLPKPFDLDDLLALVSGVTGPLSAEGQADATPRS